MIVKATLLLDVDKKTLMRIGQGIGELSAWLILNRPHGGIESIVPQDPDDNKKECPECEGGGELQTQCKCTGTIGGRDCLACGNSGYVSAGKCHRCKGDGSVPKEECPECEGTGRI